MARAGFYAIQNSKIRFGRDGRWYADDQPIVNQRIADLFSRHVERSADGTYLLRVGPEQAPIIVDDTPYVVVGVKVRNDRVCVELNDHTVEPLHVNTLHVGDDQVLYCAVKAGSEKARFLRPAYYQIAQYVSEPEPGRFVLKLGGISHRIARR